MMDGGSPTPSTEVGCQLYRHFDASGALLYVGISLSAFSRLAQHREHSHWFSKIEKVTIEHFSTRVAAIEAERKAIFDEKPLHNIRHKSRLEEEKMAATRYELSRRDLMTRTVSFRPAYSFSEAGQLLCISDGAVRKLVKTGKLSAVLLDGTKTKWLITGWQLIDYLENLERRCSSPATS